MTSTEEEGVATQITAIVVNEDDSGMIEAHVVKCKGPQDEWVIERLCKDIEGFGRREICFKTDGEPALVAVQVENSHEARCENVPRESSSIRPQGQRGHRKRGARRECEANGNQNCA